MIEIIIIIACLPLCIIIAMWFVTWIGSIIEMFKSCENDEDD